MLHQLLRPLLEKLLRALKENVRINGNRGPVTVGMLRKGETVLDQSGFCSVLQSQFLPDGIEGLDRVDRTAALDNIRVVLVEDEAAVGDNQEGFEHDVVESSELLWKQQQRR